MATYLLVHGGFQGGWAYRRVARLLRGAGHEVYTPTLTALGERSHLAYVQVNLDTHVADIGNVILWEDLEDVILVGHSYGGIVVTGVADRMPERIAALVYLDALVPADGDSLFKLRPDYLARFIAKAADSGGLAIAPGAASAFDTRLPADWAWIDAKTTPHPLACFTQAIRLTGDANPLHVDPSVARAAGFDRPILHGLCGFGMTCRAVLEAYPDVSPGMIASHQARFSAPVYPGETLAVDLWRDRDGVSFRARVIERDVVAISRGRCGLRGAPGRPPPA